MAAAHGFTDGAFQEDETRKKSLVSPAFAGGGIQNVRDSVVQALLNFHVGRGREHVVYTICRRDVDIRKGSGNLETGELFQSVNSVW